MKPVYLEWVDSALCGSGWKPQADLSELLDTQRTRPCFTMGWVTEETPEHLLVCPHLHFHTDGDYEATGSIMIPKVAVIRREDL